MYSERAGEQECGVGHCAVVDDGWATMAEDTH